MPSVPFLLLLCTLMSDMQNGKLFSINIRLHKYLQCYIVQMFIFAAADQGEAY